MFWYTVSEFWTVYYMKSKSTPSTRSDLALFALRSRILHGELEPGRLLAESAVARELGVSRVPVREALFTLERQGLVEFSDTGRAYVKDLSPADFEELFVLRLTLEPLATRLAANRLRGASEELKQNIAATKRAKSVREVTQLDLDFHEIILDASGNRRLLKLWSSLRCELELWLGRLHCQHQLQTSDTRRATAAAHEKIIQALDTQSSAECERLMRRHILGWREWLPVLPETE